MSHKAPSSAADFLPERLNLTSLRRAAAVCRGCDLYRHATQTVFGEGLRRSQVVLVGEQPGDQEDRQGRPFVGPAGRLLYRAMDDAGLGRKDVYITNAVKHFKWELRGKRRIHKKPDERELAACRPWLEAELQVIEPQVVVCLGLTAARALFAHNLRLKDVRGQFRPSALGPTTYVTAHPSAVLRLRSVDGAGYEREYRRLVDDLRAVADRVRQR